MQEFNIGCFFPAGSLVLMYDGSLKNIEDVKFGDLIRTATGHSQVLIAKTETLGAKKLLQFTDGHTWAETLAHWTYSDTDQSQAWWSYTALFDEEEPRLKTGAGYSLAHLSSNKFSVSGITELAMPEDTPIYTLVTSGQSMIVDGYIVTGIDKLPSVIDWDVDQNALFEELAKLNLRGEMPEPLVIPLPPPPISE